ncbi:MAG TPA: T9SS type A sorting domain-containing protein, partial [Chitinophagales bacterium]|nr:T9SS type A sorting domain-containing protein [Chitinophagales bacterium]
DGTMWHEENNGLPRVPVYRMIETNLYTDGCKVLYIGTHGRGMWRCTTLTPAGCQTSLATDISEIKKSGVSSLNIYPNPVSSSSHVSLYLDNKTDVTIRIFDMTGKLYQEKTYHNTVTGENIFDFDASGLSNGNYLLAATAGQTRTQSRLFTVVK